MIATWLLIVFATGVLAFVGVTAYQVWDANDPSDVIWGLALLPWIVGPVALAALLVARARSRVEAWLFAGAEVAVVASTTWIWFVVTFIKTGHENSENGIALILLPLFQLVALWSYGGGVLAIAAFLRWKRSARV